VAKSTFSLKIMVSAGTVCVFHMGGNVDEVSSNCAQGFVSAGTHAGLCRYGVCMFHTGGSVDEVRQGRRSGLWGGALRAMLLGAGSQKKL